MTGANIVGCPSMSREYEILRYIAEYSKAHGWAPTVREIGKGVGISSTSTVSGYLHRLSKKKLITLHPRSPRAIRLTDLGEKTVGK